MNEENVRSRRIPVSLIVMLIGVVILIIGIIVWKVGGVDKYIKIENFSVTNQPVDEIDTIELDIGDAEFKIVRGTTDRLSLVAENVPEGEYDHGIRDGKFVLKRKPGFSLLLPQVTRWFSESDLTPKITLTLPDKEFKRVDLDLGTGTTVIEDIRAVDLDLDLGAGQAVVRNLKVSGDTDLDLGVGEARFENCDVNRLDIDGGVGRFTFTGTITGSLDADCGVGESDITIIGNANDYDIDVDNGLGDVDIEKGDTSVGGTKHIPVKIDGGVGAIKLKFVKQ